MPNFTLDSSSLSPSTDVQSSYANTNNNTNSRDTIDSEPVIISSTHTTPSDIPSTALTIGSAKTTTTHAETDNHADPGHSGFSSTERSDHQATLGGRIKEMIHDNQLVINTFIAGGLAGATSRTVVSPLERLKIILYVHLHWDRSLNIADVL